jgi:hypothetical protein
LPTVTVLEVTSVESSVPSFAPTRRLSWSPLLPLPTIAQVQ